MSKKIVFITGGARSGKSSFALREALKVRGGRAFIATAEATDSEMEERIERHKKDRGDGWKTYEEPVKIAEVLRDAEKDHPVIVIDCLTIWLANVMMQSGLDVEAEIERLLSTLKNSARGEIFIVSNEVGMGIVPEHELARRFRDAAGRLNQRVAATADEVYVTFSGIPVRIKG
ncbi:MAG TPA: bifunctional adenosylcobinamide kinase/adenosylcobinamide-phosphate guanylyltransferase [Thermodesulfovibrionales bacterium]|nr:bifunctional adenosylcobinamide kinase/adenosylcobinamide-phosphate guanylyltransferase [Thermodesulfovibrionales bacterium]